MYLTYCFNDYNTTDCMDYWGHKYVFVNQKTVQVIDEKQDISLRGLKLLYQHLAMALDICLSLNMNNSLATLCCST